MPPSEPVLTPDTISGSAIACTPPTSKRATLRRVLDRTHIRVSRTPHAVRFSELLPLRVQPRVPSVERFPQHNIPPKPALRFYQVPSLSSRLRASVSSHWPSSPKLLPSQSSLSSRSPRQRPESLHSPTPLGQPVSIVPLSEPTAPHRTRNLHHATRVAQVGAFTSILDSVPFADRNTFALAVADRAPKAYR